jgi:hypothetical protein
MVQIFKFTIFKNTAKRKNEKMRKENGEKYRAKTQPETKGWGGGLLSWVD